MTAKLSPTRAYGILVTLYIYVIRLLVGFFVSGGLLLLKFTPSRNWQNDVNISIWLSPMHAILFCATCGFLLVAAFIPPSKTSLYSSKNLHYPWYIVPTIGLTSLTWGLVWYLGLRLVMFQRKKELVVTRRAYTVPDRAVPGQWVMKRELVSHEWHANIAESTPGTGQYELCKRRQF